MAGIASNIGYYLIGKQSAKGVAATTFKRYRAAGDPSLMPVKEFARYNETDIGRDQGDTYLSQLRVEGDIPLYLRPDTAATLLYGVLGTNADSGTNPNYTHTITPADTLPYWTIQRTVGTVILEQYLDCQFNTLRIESSAGGTPMVTLGIIGTIPSWLAALGTETTPTGDPYKHWEAKGLISIGGSAQLVHDLTLEINNNLIGYLADDVVYSDVDPGRREVTFSFAMHFTGPTAEPKYREFFYGSDAGTTYATSITAKVGQVIWRKNANTEVKIDIPELIYSAVPVGLSASGDPIDVEVACEVEKPSGSPIITATVKDQTATVP